MDRERVIVLGFENQFFCVDSPFNLYYLMVNGQFFYTSATDFIVNKWSGTRIYNLCLFVIVKNKLTLFFMGQSYYSQCIST